MTEIEIARNVESGFGVRVKRVELLRHNENMTYHVYGESGEYVLRVHRPADGFDTGVLKCGDSPQKLIERESELLNFLSNAGLCVQRPAVVQDGGYILDMDGAPSTLLSWLPGKTLSEIEHTRALGEKTGQMAARMHALLMKFDGEHGRGGYSYDATLLPVLEGQFVLAEKAGAMSAGQFDCLRASLDAICRRMQRLDAQPGALQTVHADLSPGNMLFVWDEVAPIDFSLSGASYRQMDIAGLFAQLEEPEMRAGILAGYAREFGEDIALCDIEPFFALQIMLFIGCQWNRFAGQDWFGEALERWRAETFAPLASEKPFLSM